MYVLDSSALVEIIRNGPRAKKVFDLAGEEALVTTSVSLHEVLSGALTGKDTFVLQGIFAGAQILEHDAEAAKLGADIQKILTKNGTKINSFDILIAATCKANGATLIALDQDFVKIKGLSLTIIK